MNTVVSAKGFVISFMTICVLLQRIGCPRPNLEVHEFTLPPGQEKHGLITNFDDGDLVLRNKGSKDGYTVFEIKHQNQNKYSKFTIPKNGQQKIDNSQKFVKPRENSITVKITPP